jgi:hypothetical protein
MKKGKQTGPAKTSKQLVLKMQLKKCRMCFLLHSTLPLKSNGFSLITNRIGGVMVSVLASSVVDRGFEPRSGQTKDNKIGICCFSGKHAVLRRKSKDLAGSESR